MGDRYCNPKRTHVCTYCGKPFFKVRQLKGHEKNCSNKKTFEAQLKTNPEDLLNEVPEGFETWEK
jgi:hypothetical protein